VSAGFFSGINPQPSTEERRRVRLQLEDYCGRDTEGMIWIIDALRASAGRRINPARIAN